MSSHRRPGVLARALRLLRTSKTAVLVPRRAGVELVDAHSGVRHRVTPEELVAGRAWGDYEAFCCARLRAASLIDPGRRECRECVS